MEQLPKSNTEYSTVQYWDQRYEGTKETRYDWFKGYDSLKEVFKELIDPSAKILQLGCGNSKLSEDMYNDGFKNIVNIDFSENVIQQMKIECATMTEMSWVTMDITEMSSFGNGSFDIAIDKGTMDALMCEKGDVWELDEEVARKCHSMCAEVSRVLKPNGLYIQITFGQPHFRKPVLNKPEYGWSLEVRTLGEHWHYYVYVMRRQA